MYYKKKREEHNPHLKEFISRDRRWRKKKKDQDNISGSKEPDDVERDVTTAFSKERLIELLSPLESKTIIFNESNGTEIIVEKSGQYKGRIICRNLEGFPPVFAIDRRWFYKGKDRRGRLYLKKISDLDEKEPGLRLLCFYDPSFHVSIIETMNDGAIVKEGRTYAFEATVASLPSGVPAGIGDAVKIRIAFPDEEPGLLIEVNGRSPFEMIEPPRP